MRFWVIAAVALLATTPCAAAEKFRVYLDGLQEVPPVVTAASGSAVLLLDESATELAISLMLDGVDLDGTGSVDSGDDVTGIHFHNAPAGVNGSVVFGFFGSPFNNTDLDSVVDPGAGTVTAGWDSAEGNSTTLTAQLPNLRAGNLYLNVHTVGNPGGRIRGHVVPVLFDDGFESGDTLAWSDQQP